MKFENYDLIPRAELRGFINYFKKRAYLYVTIFTFGFIVGYPISGEIIEWFLESDRYKPDGVQIIILQPMEVILLKLQIAVKIGFLLLSTSLIMDLSKNSRNIIKESKRNSALTKDIGYRALLLSVISSVILGILGIIYSHQILIPFLLDYLAQDAVSAGLSSTWRLKSWIGFISGLYFSSIIGFQIPLLTILLIKSNIIDRNEIIENRRALWFVSLLFGAIVSPPDPLSLFLVGGPILILLEIALLIDKISEKYQFLG